MSNSGVGKVVEGRFSGVCRPAACLAALLLYASVAQANNLDASAVYIDYDADTQALLDARIAGGWTAGVPLLQNGDEIGLIIKAVPDNGTNTGVGGYTTFYLPTGVQVLDAAYVLPGDDPSDGINGYDRIPMKGQALMPNVGAGGGPTVSLVGFSRGPNIAGVTGNLVNAFNVNGGTLPGVYGDLGIFYSTAPETAYGTYAGGALKNNSGDIVGWRTELGTPLNLWDAWQLAGYGIAGTTNPAYPSSPLLDSNGRGNTAWGLANAVAGPESGYAWDFDLQAYAACDPIPFAPTPACLNAATSSVGPWQRIRYPGSQIAYDVPGDITAGKFNGGLDASDVGFDLVTGDLPVTTGQADGSPNAVRWAYGQLTLNTPEFAWIKIRIVDYTGTLDPTGCPNFHLDTFGGDAGGDDNGKDHIWRYYDPNSRTWNGCLAVGKPATREAVKVGETFQYNVQVYNTGATTLSNVTITDTLPGGVTFLSAAPAQSSGPNPLVWNIGTLAPGQSYSSVVTVKSAATGVLTNTVTVTGTPPVGPPVSSTSTERTPSGTNLPILSQGKEVSPATVVAPGVVQYTIRIENIGSGSTGNPVRITENLPTGFSYQSLASVVVNGATVTGLVTVNNSNPNTPVFTVPLAIQAQKELVLVFNASVAAGTPSGTYCNSYVTNQNATNLSTGSLACVIVGGGTIGDTVFRDWDGNGIQDSGDEGLAGVTLSLYAGACPPVGMAIDTEITDAAGFYQFTGLPAGSYCVDAPAPGSGGVPSGYTLSTANDPATVTLATNEVRNNVDFGFEPGGAGSIGDTVFDDTNADGAFNGSDAGIAGVTVRLYEDTSCNGVLDPALDALVATTATNGSGAYLFPGLATGVCYIVDVDQADPDIAAYFVATYGSSTGVIQTTSDPHVVGPLAGAYTAADFGFYKIVPGSIGDDVFVDLDADGIRDAGEAGLPGVTVRLYQDTNGNGVLDVGEPLLATVVTDANGNYLFENLPAGNYVVDVDEGDPDVPTIYFPARDPIAVVLLAAEERTDVDFPFVRLLTKSVNLAYDDPATLPNTLTYTITPRYPSANLLASAEVMDLIPTGTTFLNSPPASPNASGEAVDEDENTVIDLVRWSLGSNTPGSLGYTGGTTDPACQTTMTITAEADTWIAQASPTLNYGAATNIRTTNAANDNVGLLRFPITASTLPVGATLDGVQLRMTPSAGAGADRQVEIRSLLTAFTEGTQNGAACVAGAAWQGPNCTDDWLSAGGNFGTSDYGATSLGTLNPTNNGTTTTTSGAALQAVIAGWLTGGTNRGLAMIPVGAATNNVDWNTRTAATAALRPQIVLTYTPNGCSGTTVIRDTGANEIPDTFIQQDSPASNFGTNNRLRTRAQDTRKKHALLRFNLSSVPAAATISSATMRVEVKTGKSNQVDEVRRLTTAWTEGTGATNGASWNDANGTGTAGTWAGGAFSSADYGTTVHGTITPSTSGAKTVALTSLVQGWHTGAFTNNGLVLLATGTNTADVEYFSSEEGTATRRPSLTVNWSIPPTGFTGTSSIATGWTLAQVGDSFPVTMTVATSGPSVVAGVVPSALTVSGAGGANATCGAASPAVANVPAFGSVTFTWTCTVTAVGADVGSVTFSASASNGTTIWSTAASNSVLVSPVLQFQVNVNNPPGVTQVNNTAELDSAGLMLATSNTVTTALTAAIGDFVWVDVDADGVQDAGEPGLAGARVFLDLNANGTWDAGEPFDTTDALGGYLITGLASGTYAVLLDLSTLPPGYYPTTSPSLSRTITASGQQVTDADFGVTSVAGPGAASIGDTVWLDRDEDGVVDADESGIPGVPVLLYRDVNGDGILDAGDYVVGTTTTDAAGNYLFDGLYGDDYLVVVDTSAPVTTEFGVVTTIAASMDLVSGVNPRPVSLADGEDYVGADFGFNWGGSIGDFAWYDKNGNGVQDGPAVGCNNADPLHECGAPGMTAVLVYDVNGNGIADFDEPILAAAVTDSSGYYLFDNLPPGNYVVSSSEQEVPAPDSSPNAGNIGVMVHTAAEDKAIALAGNQDYLDADFGFLEAAVVEGHVYHDADRNGLFDPAETPIPGITVTLVGTDANGFPVSLTTTTDASGEYLFLVPPGDYTITYETTAPPMPANLAQETTPLSIAVSPVAGQELSNLDFGRDDIGRIGDRVWNDADGDGLQDVGETGLAGVTVLLWLDPNGDGNLADATFVEAQATDAFGNYLFEGLADTTGAARYVVQVAAGTLPAGFAPTGDPNEAGTCVVCDNQSVVQLTGGASILTQDFGYRSPVSYAVTGTVFGDDGLGGGIAMNGIQDGAEAGVGAGVVVTAEVDFDNDGNVDLTVTTTTNAAGNYSFPGLPAGSAVVITVDENTLPSGALIRTNDTDGAADATITIANLSADVADRDFGYLETTGSISGTICVGSGDGLCDDAGETPGLAGLTVTLLYAGMDGILGTGDDVTAAVLTDASGNYLFDATTIGAGNCSAAPCPLENGLPPGLYQVVKTDPSWATGLADADGGNPDIITVWLGVDEDRLAQDFEVELGATDLVIAKDDGTSVYVAGGSLTYTITASNLGPNDVVGATVSDTFPPQLQNATWTCSGTAGASCSASGSGDISDMVSLAVGSSVTYLVSVDVLAGTTVDPLINTATVTPPTGVTDSNPANNTDDDQDSPAAAPAAIGDRLWLDEDGDGVQDAGEDGLAGVTVALYDATGTVLVATTTTDGDGRYLFSGLAAGDYVVRVDASTLPAGLAAHPTYDLDDGTVAPDAETAVAAVAGVLVDTADFGFNWVAPSDSASPAPGATGAIGDRIWNDADGDGIQDAGESGIAGVTVRLLTDSNGDGIYGGAGDAAAIVTATNAAGNYIFDGLAPGAYVVEVDTTTLPAGFSTLPTGDPDSDGDNVSNPIVLAPGDVFVNADFGYPLPTGLTIGTVLYLDADADGVRDAGEPGLAGVTVSLLDDDGNVIASTTTDADGQYFFPGLPDGTYTVLVTDTAGVLFDTPANTGDPDGGNDRLSTVVLAGTDNLYQDFGFAPAGHDPGDGLIGDTIFLDRDGNGLFDAGEGLEGVTVGLYDATGTTLIATAVTDSGGQYVFGGLDATSAYVVRVDATTLPGAGAGLTNSVDPDGGVAGESLVDLAGYAGGITLTQDFGYQADTPNTIQGTVWNDLDGDGTLDAGETGGYEGVVVILRDADGNVVATTTTDAAGDYQFTGLPDGTYTVDVAEDGNVLGGLAKSDGPSPGTDGNSQEDAYTVTVAGGVTDSTGDFGYYSGGAAVGNFVFYDVNGDGIQDPGETGMAGVTVTLQIVYPNGDVTTVVTVTDAQGAYSFGNLLLDEDFDGTGAGEPTYTISVATPAGYQASPTGVGSDRQLDSNDPAGSAATPVQGVTDATDDALASNGIDFGFTSVADVQVVKTGPASLVPGTSVVFTVAVTNNGPSPAADVNVTDPTPVGLTFVSNTGACTSPYPCALGTLASGAVRTITSTYAVPASYTTPNPVVNTATVSTSTTDPVPSNDSDPASAVVSRSADLSIVKVGPGGVTPGTNLVYTILVTNNGPSDAGSVSVADPTPTGLTFVSNSGACTSAFPCALGTVESGGTRTITATYSVPASYSTPSPIVNTATVSSSTSDPVPGNNSSTESTVPTPTQADLAIVKTGPASAVPGSNVVYTVVVTNNGPASATGTTVTDPTPPGLVFVSNSGACATAYPCSLGSIPSGSTRTITSTYAVPASYTTPVVIQNTAVVSADQADSVASNNSALTSTPVVLSADVSVAKSGPASVVAGSNVVYTVSVTNNGPSDATAVSLADPTPAGLTFVSNAGACSTAYPCALGTIPSGQTRTVTSTYSVPLSYTAPNPAVNTATVSTATPDPSTGNNSSSASTAVSPPNWDLSLVKWHSGVFATCGTASYLLQVMNGGRDPSSGFVTVTDVLPAGITFVSASGSGWNCSAAGQAVTCTTSSAIPAGGASTVVTIAVAIGEAAFPTVVNVASVQIANDANPVNNSTSHGVTVRTGSCEANPEPEICPVSLRKVYSGDTSPGGEVEYRLQWSNACRNDLRDVTISDPLPAGLTLVSAYSPDATTLIAGNTVTFRIAVYPAGDVGQGVIRARVDAGATPGATIRNVALLSDTSGHSARAEVTLRVREAGDICPVSLRKLHSGNNNPGGEIQYTLQWSNACREDIEDVTITDPMPAGLQLIAATSSDAEVTISGDTVTFRMAGFRAGSVGKGLVTARIDPEIATGTTIRNVASLQSADGHALVATNTLRVRGGSIERYRLTCFVRAQVFARPGRYVKYEVRYKYGSENNALTLTLPDEVQIDWIYPPPSSQQGNSLSWEDLATTAGKVTVNTFVGFGAEDEAILPSSAMVDDGLGNVAVCEHVGVVNRYEKLFASIKAQSITRPGSSIRYTARYREAIGHNRMTISLPSEITVKSIWPAPTGGTARTLEWTDLPTPAGAVKINAVVNSVPDGTVLVASVMMADESRDVVGSEHQTIVGAATTSTGTTPGQAALSMSVLRSVSAGTTTDVTVRYEGLQAPASLRLDLPPEMSPVLAVPSATFGPNSAEWASLPGSSGSVKVRVAISAGAAPGKTLVVSAAALDAGGATSTAQGSTVVRDDSTTSAGGGLTMAMSLARTVTKGLTTDISADYDGLQGTGQLTITLPPGMTLQSSVPSGAKVSGQEVTWSGLSSATGSVRARVLVSPDAVSGSSLAVGGLVSDSSGASASAAGATSVR